MNEIKEFIGIGLSANDRPIETTEQDIFLLGDLNVEGDLSNVHNTINLSGSATAFDNLGEWTSYFNSNGNSLANFFTFYLRDMWAN